MLIAMSWKDTPIGAGHLWLNITDF